MKAEDKDIELLKHEAKSVIYEKVQKYAEIMGVKYGRITIRCQKSRWGSCSIKGNLNFNCLLMLTPDYIQNYVVVHELAHRIEMNHSQNFWNIVEAIIPDYRKSKKWLKENGVELIQKYK